MSAEEAEKVIERKLVNYFIQKSGFQRNVETARKIVAELGGRKRELERVI